MVTEAMVADANMANAMLVASYLVAMNIVSKGCFTEDHLLFLLLFFDAQTKTVFSLCWNRWTWNIKERKYFVKSLERGEVPNINTYMNNLPFDIYINTLGGVSSLAFLEEADLTIGMDHLLKKSVILIKAWLKYETEPTILKSSDGLLSTYALEVMILYIINRFSTEVSTPLQSPLAAAAVRAHLQLRFNPGISFFEKAGWNFEGGYVEVTQGFVDMIGGLKACVWEGFLCCYLRNEVTLLPVVACYGSEIIDAR
ncbi:hypothetical protein CTI12_AA470420 [Artemisia annua]|uniref:PAP/OAS1 substrate-binding-related domain-containing protein n=1 Tax=Artemisia annua TaxID=35608 RepID=A0A2U1LNX5_ARTAN|nr:hypothetical protein CTI12_AA470420 [Artemisia annua]